MPAKADHDWVKSIFEKYGSVAYISLPKFKSGAIKRFAFVEFINEESAKNVIEVKFNLYPFKIVYFSYINKFTYLPNNIIIVKKSSKFDY